jgi:NAD+-dependent protein deacetylase sirtuin 4
MHDGVTALAGLLAGRRVLLLSGAGISTESGIPDYRGPAARARPVKPITFREFMSGADARARYWSGSLVGWPRIARAVPNAGHAAAARMERAGALLGVITQNVDGLHQAAGSCRVVELHGSLSEAGCVGCGAVVQRGDLQQRMLRDNPAWAGAAGDATPDGDTRLDASHLPAFVVPSCPDCGGILKPRVVFFGENVPPEVTGQAFRLLDEAEVLLVAGSSLAVYSGFRFVERAARDGKPVAIVNEGETRGDSLAALRLDLPLGEALPLLASLLGGQGGACGAGPG